MTELYANLITILTNIEGQFQVSDLDTEKAWTSEAHGRFWTDFQGLTAILRHEINKLALVVDVNDCKKAKPEEIKVLLNGVEKAAVTLWSTFLQLSHKSGVTFCENVAKTCQILINSTLKLVTALSQCSKRQEALQHVGEIWSKCDLILSQLPKDNVSAVALAIQEQRNLVQDALQELENHKQTAENEHEKHKQTADSDRKQIADSDSEQTANSGDDDDKWSANEMQVLSPSIGLMKTCIALLKKVEQSVRKSGSAEFCQELDAILKHCEEISPKVDDFVLSLYAPIDVEDLEQSSCSLKDFCQEIIVVRLKNKHFVLAKELEEWGAFLLKALDHNFTKLKASLAVLSLEKVKIEN